MNKKIVILTAVFALTTGYVLAAEMTAEPAVETGATEGAPAAIEVGNQTCPLSGRELNLNDANDYTKLEVEGYVFNVCPKAKAEYDKDASKYADKIATAISNAKVSPEPVYNNTSDVGTYPDTGADTK